MAKRKEEKEMTKELAKTLTTALVQWIDRERPEGTMCCSNYECEKLEKAFEGGCYDVVESLIKKKLTRLTEFQNAVRVMITEALTTHIKDGNGREMSSTVFISDDTAILLSAGLLKLAKKELLKEWNENMKDEYARGKKDGLTIGYNNGYKDAEKRYNESVAYHFPEMPATPSVQLCDGIHCINPHMDCINCPRKTTGGGFNTSSGTSTLKAEG